MRAQRKIVAKEKKVKDWRLLKRGTIVKVSGGPYHVTNGSKHKIGVKGVCKVSEILENGIMAFKDRATVFIYMGPEREGIVGINKAHELKELIYE